MPVVNREVVLPVPRERAWELVTEPDEMETWLAEDVEFEPEEGAPLRIDEREGVVEHVTDEERIVFTWGDSMVEWVLEDHPAGTRFVVTEHRFVDDEVGDVVVDRRADEDDALAQQSRVDVERALAARVLLHDHGDQRHVQPPSCAFRPMVAYVQPTGCRRSPCPS